MIRTATTTTRVPEHTPAELNDRIRDMTEGHIAHYARHPEQIDQRLRELDEEWDIERVLEVNMSAIALCSFMLGTMGSRRWHLITTAVLGFFLQHAIQGWCPPVPLFRRMGVRTSTEIEAERYALKALRGDFQNISEGVQGAEEAIKATGRLS